MEVEIAFDVNETRKISWQEEFPKTVKCCQKNCKGEARLGFVAHEGFDSLENPKNKKTYVCQVHKSTGKKGGLWLHDCCVVAVYFCEDCLEPTAIYNQA